MTHWSRHDRDPFELEPPVELALSLESEEIVDRLSACRDIKLTIPAGSFEVRYEDDQYLTIVEGQAADSMAAELAVSVCQEEFGLLPRSLIKNTRLRRVVLCGNLFRSQKLSPLAANHGPGQVEWDIQPLQFEREPTGGLPDVANGLLYLSIEGVEQDSDRLRKAIHHEFYHCIQWQQFGDPSDPEWESINPPDFVYGPGGIAACFDSESDFHSTATEEWGNGFLNLYCMSAPEEDQAEVFSHLITEPARVESRLAVDDVFRRKVERLKATLNEFCRDIDDRFWRRVSDSRLPFDY